MKRFECIISKMNELNFNSKQINWDDLRAFLAIARAGGLAAAAKDIGLSAPTLGRKMLALERGMDQELFIRRTHGYDLTDAGHSLMEDLEGVSDQIGRLTALQNHDALPLVKISAGTWTSHELARNWQNIVGTPADVRIRFVSTETFLSLSRREISIAIRNRRPTETGLAAHKLAGNEFSIYATPNAPDDWIIHTVETPSSTWAKERAKTGFFHEVNNPRLALDLALAGAGQLILPTFIGDQETALERRSGAIEELSHDAWLVFHDDDRNLPEIRRVIDRIYSLRKR
ncbi:MAG: LysR family transcriptional regulator [Lentilitoribacter sp.]